MKIQQFLAHHGLSDNPFSQEDAKEDRIFKRGCIHHTFHPAWDKIIGDPESPSSAVVFGEKGSGKTALRLQMIEYLTHFNEKHPDQRVLILEYDDFNPFLDQFCRQERDLARWELRDHMDAILSLGTRKLVDMILSRPAAISDAQIAGLSRLEKRDLLMLAAVYDSSHETTLAQRWHALRRPLHFDRFSAGWLTRKEFGLGVLVTVALIAGLTYFHWWNAAAPYWWAMLAILIAAWVPFARQWFRASARAARIDQWVRPLPYSRPDLRHVLLWLRPQDIDGQPVCMLDTSDARYVLLNKLQGVLRKLGYRSIVVIVDRVDEPHRVSGNAAIMHRVMRSIFDLKFLQHPDLGIKLLLPGDLYAHIQSENQEFRDRARLDKQKLVPTLAWTAQSLEDLVNDRLATCAADGAKPTLRSLLDEQIRHDEVSNHLAELQIPRHVFKFFYQLIAAHCNNHTDANPEWKIGRDTFLTTWAVFQRDLQRYDQGLIMG
jgi:hypothetical protein